MIRKSDIDYAVKNKQVIPPPMWKKTYFVGETDLAKKYDGSYFASFFNSVVTLVQDTKADVDIQPDTIVILNSHGIYHIHRNTFVNYFLLPLIDPLL